MEVVLRSWAAGTANISAFAGGGRGSPGAAVVPAAVQDAGSVRAGVHVEVVVGTGAGAVVADTDQESRQQYSEGWNRKQT